MACVHRARVQRSRRLRPSIVFAAGRPNWRRSSTNAVHVDPVQSDLRYQFVSRAYAEMLGCEPADIAGKAIVEVMGEDGFEPSGPMSRPFYQGRVLTSSAPFGSKRPVFISCGWCIRRTPIHEATCKGGLRPFSISATQARRRSARAARRHRRFVDDAIISKTLDGIITSWNAGAERIFGYAAAEAIGQSIAIIMPPERQGEELGIIRLLRRGEKVEPFET